MIRGSTRRKPYQNFPQKPISVSPNARACWSPTFHIPKSIAGIRATITTLITRLRSIQSLMCAPLFVTVAGTKRNDSKASKVEWSHPNFPPFSKEGLIFCVNFNKFISNLLFHIFNHNINTFSNNLLNIYLGWADILAKRKVLLHNLKDAKSLHLLYILCKNSL